VKIVGFTGGEWSGAKMSWSRVGRTRAGATGPSPKMPPSIELLSIAIAEEFAVRACW